VKSKYTDAGAVISACGRYRYLLWREWRGTHDRKNWHWYGERDGNGAEYGQPKACVFVMLNPSTADGETDDPTIRRCVAYAKAWRYERLEVVNLFALRATDPRVLLALQHWDDPVGVDNQHYIERAAHDAGVIVCAWGAHGGHIGQDETVLGWIGRRTYALGTTKAGHPKRPLYLRSDAPLVHFSDVFAFDAAGEAVS
jgi:hypothetical protein